MPSVTEEIYCNLCPLFFKHFKRSKTVDHPHWHMTLCIHITASMHIRVHIILFYTYALWPYLSHISLFFMMISIQKNLDAPLKRLAMKMCKKCLK